MARGKRALVTGGAGFIGSHLCKRLLYDGYEVICLDNLYTGSKKNIEELLGQPSFNFVTHDVTQPLHFVVDEIYNLACPASPVHYQLDPVKTLQTSILGALNAADLACRTGAKLLQASTSEIYGDPLEHPQNETYWGNVNVLGPRSCYDEGKRCAETIVYEYCRKFELDVKIVRIFNTYGPHMHPSDGRVVSNFIVQALLGQEITVYGEGNHTRSFCYISDLIEGLIRMMGTEPSIMGPVNLGNPQEFTIKELAAKVIKLTGARTEITFNPIPPDDPRQRKPNIDLARSLLQWEPKVCLEEGLLKTIEYFARKLGKE